MSASQFHRILLLVLCASGTGLAFGRERVVALVPQSAALFERVGLPVNLDHLEIGPVHAVVVQEGEKRVLQVEAEIVNPRKTAAPVPLLRLAVRNAAGGTVYVWTTTAGAKTITGGGRIPVRARLASPPDGADVTMAFATASTGGAATVLTPPRG